MKKKVLKKKRIFKEKNVCIRISIVFTANDFYPI